jgi:hypothetical protein
VFSVFGHSAVLLPVVLFDKGTSVMSSVTAVPSVTLTIYVQTGKIGTSSICLRHFAFFFSVNLQEAIKDFLAASEV